MYIISFFIISLSLLLYYWWKESKELNIENVEEVEEDILSEEKYLGDTLIFTSEEQVKKFILENGGQISEYDNLFADGSIVICHDKPEERKG
jgi:hypothetical protein